MSFNLEDRLILFTSPGTLSRIASFKLALFCWQQHLKNYESSSLFVEIKTTIRVSDVIKVSLPKPITEMINRHIELLKWKLYSWSEHHSNVFKIFQYKNNIILNFLDCIILKPSGSIICFESTAMNLIKSDRLTKQKKSLLVRKYYSTENPDLRFNKCSCLPTQLKYWSETKANIPKLSAIHDDDETSLNTVIFLLSHLDTTLQNELIRRFSIKLFRILALHDEEPSVRTLQLWHHVKDHVTDDQFVDLIEFLCNAAFNTCSIDSYVAVLLDEIWTTASNHQQTKVVNCFNFPYFIMKPITFGSNDMRCYGRSMEFFLHILSGLSFKKRNKVWCRYWDSFICVARVSDLIRLLRLCLKDADEVAEFIKNFMANYSMLKKQLQEFILKGKYRELTEYLTFFYPDEKSVQDTLQKLLNSLLEDNLIDCMADEPLENDFIRIHVWRFNLYSDQCIRFNDLIDDAFPSKDIAQQFKKDFILQYVESKKSNLSRSFMLEEIRDMAEAFFTNEQRCLIEMKLKIYEICRPFAVLIKPETELPIRTRMIREWREFFKWCGSEEVPVLKIGRREAYVVVCSEFVRFKVPQKSQKVKGFKNFFSKVKGIF